jgi:hypothetical protein
MRVVFTLAAFIALWAFAPANAQQSASGLQSYDVELVVFRHLSTAGTEEQWTLESMVGEQVEIPEEDASPFEGAPQVAPVVADGFPALSASKFKLTAMYESLRRSRNYQPLAHFGWTQPGFSRASAPFFPINAFVPSSTGVTGRIALSRGRYLHLTLDLEYTAPATATEPARRYVLRQSRRMRSNERHYIDHPMFGVIALVTPSAQ